jgi:hypothetical protein
VRSDKSLLVELKIFKNLCLNVPALVFSGTEIMVFIVFALEVCRENSFIYFTHFLRNVARGNLSFGHRYNNWRWSKNTEVSE